MISMLFAVIGLFSGIILVGSFIFGHDHDVGADHDHDFGGDHDHDHGGGQSSPVSIFSVKVIAMFLTGFGGTGWLASSYYGLGPAAATLWGTSSELTGFVFGSRQLYGYRYSYN